VYACSLDEGQFSEAQLQIRYPDYGGERADIGGEEEWESIILVLNSSLYDSYGSINLGVHSLYLRMICTIAEDFLAYLRLRLRYPSHLNDYIIKFSKKKQLSQVETMIPMLLQKSDVGGKSRLKRVCLIGDHHQLPPIIKNRAFQKFG
jgi:hypothetical protein